MGRVLNLGNQSFNNPKSKYKKPIQKQEKTAVGASGPAENSLFSGVQACWSSFTFPGVS